MFHVIYRILSLTQSGSGMCRTTKMSNTGQHATANMGRRREGRREVIEASSEREAAMPAKEG
ncbi:hypothetical protein PRIPAC_70224 [Pristionchus pacificus]|uniref:Uncharacterized protein n=1 Tax=Pristionchus pacificus TaxID=54126 RepID=A0A2A6B596_PRIPA|nr:hypothetical protein PRIPAC_70224 [Pristionchus pacificus]|eukprot:PDM61049.1 hypothetical protein PRIPAC_54855 [Pristionchus pacificus]